MQCTVTWYRKIHSDHSLDGTKQRMNDLRRLWRSFYLAEKAGLLIDESSKDDKFHQAFFSPFIDV